MRRRRVRLDCENLAGFRIDMLLVDTWRGHVNRGLGLASLLGMLGYSRCAIDRWFI